MPKRSSKKNGKALDPNQLARRIVEQATGEGAQANGQGHGHDEEDDAARRLAARILGRRGGLKGGKARAESLTAKERSAIAKRAAEARWKGNGS